MIYAHVNRVLDTVASLEYTLFLEEMITIIDLLNSLNPPSSHLDMPQKISVYDKIRAHQTS